MQMSAQSRSEAPRKRRIEEYPAGTVVITKPADPEKLAALHKEQRALKKKNPSYTPDHVRFGDKPFSGEVVRDYELG